MINRENTFPIGQAKVKNYLNCLRVSDFVSEGLEGSKILAMVYKLILKLSYQICASYYGSAPRIELPRHEMVEYK